MATDYIRHTEDPAYTLRARGAMKRLAKKRLYNRRKAPQYRDPELNDIYVIPLQSWRCLLALGDADAPLRLSHFLVPGAAVIGRSARNLELHGLVKLTQHPPARDSVRSLGYMTAELTPEGRKRYERGW